MPETQRFYIQDREGRRSSVWRVMVHGDETYLAARSMFGQVKISLHSSGYCQHGFTEVVRDKLPVDEREALDRWQQPRGDPGVFEPAYMIYFPGSELFQQEEEPPASATAIPITSRDMEITVGVFFTERPLPSVEGGDIEPLNLVARLPLGRGAAVDVLWVEGPCVQGRVREVKAHYHGTNTRLMPCVISKEWDYAYGFGQHPRDSSPLAGLHWALEIASEARSRPSGDQVCG